ncbi:MAG: bacterioferritin [Cardiobacteriaceae bacterium]|nr:bacterioferritin [Cardiobacteriaceae bacterium]
MQSPPEVRACLNRLLRHELTVINQYFLHARMLNNWGYDSLGHIIYKQSIRAMKNADKLIARIFLLEGLPNLQDLGKLFIGETVAEAIACDHQVASAQYHDLRAAIATLGNVQDYVSRHLVEGLLDDVEEYIDWLETQQDLIAEIGEQHYLQQAVGEHH